MKFLHALEIDQDYLAHTSAGAGVPQKILIMNIKMGSKIQPVRLNNFRASGSILMGLFSVDAPRSRDDKMGTFLQCPPPKICDGKKIVQNFSPILTTFDFNREYLRKRSTYQKP